MPSHDPAALRVLMICPQFRPLIGGYERAAERLCAALAAAGSRVVVITERRDRRWPALESIEGYQIWRLACWYRRHVHLATSLSSLALHLVRHGRGFDAWHVHQHGHHAALAVALGKLLHRPVVLKLTSAGAMGIDEAFRYRFTRPMVSFLHRRVNACIAVSAETRAEAISFGIPEERVYDVPNGVDGRQFRPASTQERDAARRALGLNCSRLVLYVGRLAPEKNPLGLLDAWSAVDPEIRAGTLLGVVGDGPESDRVAIRAREPRLAKSVHVAGKQTDVTTWYRAADLFVIPSHREGLSNAMIEALAIVLPVISTRVSGSSILLEDPVAGLVVETGDVDALAHAIARLLQDAPLRARLGASARLKFEARFSLDSIAKRMLVLYQSLHEQNHERRSA